MTTEWRFVTARFHAFVSGLPPSPSQRRLVLSAARDVAKALRLSFHPDDGFLGIGAADHVIVGGHAKGTALGPGETIDMLYIPPPHMRPRAEAGKDILAPLFNDLTQALGAHYPRVYLTRGGWLSVEPPGLPRLDGEKVEVRLIPCFPRAGGGFTIGDPAIAAYWRHCDPKAELRRLAAADMASGGKASHLILMLKAWRRRHFVAIGSLALELLVCEFAGLWTYHRRSLLFYDWMVRDFFFWLGHQAGRSIEIPGTGVHLRAGGAWEEEAAGAFSLAREACRLERDDPVRATGAWGEIFGPGFPGSTLALEGGERAFHGNLKDHWAAALKTA